MKHDIGVKWYECSYCNHKAKSKGNLNKHIASMHSNKVEWFNCYYCDYKTLSILGLKHHVENRHTIKSNS